MSNNRDKGILISNRIEGFYNNFLLLKHHFLSQLEQYHDKETPKEYILRLLDLYKCSYFNSGTSRTDKLFIILSVLSIGRRIIPLEPLPNNRIKHYLKLLSGGKITLLTGVLGVVRDNESKDVIKQSNKILTTKIKVKRFSHQEFQSCYNRLVYDSGKSFFTITKNFGYHVTGDLSHLFNIPVITIQNMMSSFC